MTFWGITILITTLGLLSQSQAETVEIKVWHSYRDAEQVAFEDLLQQYDAAHPELTLNVLAVAYDSYASKLEAAIPRHNGPDLFVYAHEKIGTWVQDGLIQPVKLTESQLQNFHSATMTALSYNGEYYGYPLAFKCLILFRNTNLLPKAPQSTDDILLLKKLHLLDEDVFALAYPATEAFYHMPWFFGFGGGLLNPLGNIDLNSEGNIASLEFLQELNQLEILPKEPTPALMSQLFNDGKAAMVINGPWFISSIDQDIPYEVSPLPIVSKTGKPAAPLLTVESAFVSAFTNHPETAMDLAQFLTHQDAAIQRAIQGRQAVATLSAYENPSVKNDPILSVFMMQLDHSIPTPNIPEMSATWEPLARAIRRVNRNAMSAKNALEQANIEFQFYTRPPPTAANSTPYVVIAVMGLLGLLGYLGWQFRENQREIFKNKWAYAYIAPAALAMTLLTAIPFLVGAGVAFFSHYQGSLTFVGLQNFADIILARDWPVTSPLSFYFTFLVTILWTFCNVVLHVGIGLALALLLREPWLKLRGIYRVLLIIPWAIPNYITALIWKGMFHQQYGAINSLLSSLGITPISWFEHFSTSFAANLITNTWLGFPFMMVVSLGALQSIPRDLEDAASVDGASAWQRFRHITLPLLRPALLPAVILGSVWTFNMFNIIYLVSAGEPDSSTDILISDAYKWAFSRGNRYGYASAYAILIFGILLAYSKLGNAIAGKKTL